MSSGRSQSGFSLVEILVSLGAGMSVVLVVMATMASGTRGYQEATRRIDAMVEARASLGVLSDDLSTVLGGGRDQFGWEEGESGFQQVWFYTAKPVEAQDPEKAVGDICLVHYYTAVTQDYPAEGAPFSRKLYRFFLSSGDVLDQILNEQLEAPEIDPELAEVVAFNVTRFIARPLIAESNRLKPWNSQGSEEADLLEIELQVLDGDAGSALKTELDWELKSPLARQLIGGLEQRNSDRVHDFRLNFAIGGKN